MCFSKTDLKIWKFEEGRENFGQNQDPIIGLNPDPNIVPDPESEKVHDYNGTCSEARNRRSQEWNIKIIKMLIWIIRYRLHEWRGISSGKSWKPPARRSRDNSTDALNNRPWKASQLQSVSARWTRRWLLCTLLKNRSLVAHWFFLLMAHL